MRRRDALKACAALAAAVPLTGRASAATTSERAGATEPFDYAWLKGRARALAAAPYRAPSHRVPEPLRRLDWDRYQTIRYRNEHALWAGDHLRFLVKFFHLGWHYDAPIRVFEVVSGRAREIAYEPAMFELGKSGLAGAELPPGLGFAGFRINFHTDPLRDVAAFLGASYFRAVGGSGQYGLSARGLAVDCGMDRPEEFPVFTAFWIERPAPSAGTLTLYALLESPSVAGAYRFDIHPGATLVMDVAAAVYPRRVIARIGAAVLTSMYLQGSGGERAPRGDWRPEIHDSDGLALWNGQGEWIWRPLSNPRGVRFNAYQDENPRGFGLLQRYRNFDHYQDDTAYYERRPNVWVEAKSGWAKGAIDLVELPTDDEASDNIVAFWTPADKPQPGQELLYDYRLHWGDKMPVASPLAQVVATRTGIGGVVGRKREYFSWRFVIDFAGDNLPLIAKGVKVEPVITASRGKVEITSARPLASIGGYRAMFDLRPQDESTAPVDLRLYLRADGQPLTETWMYQWTPPERPEQARLLHDAAAPVARE